MDNDYDDLDVLWALVTILVTGVIIGIIIGALVF